MSINKKFYWLKLKDDFFKDIVIKKLRRIAGGDTYTIIYLKLLLLSLKNEGRLYFEGVEETFAEEMALELDEEVDNVSVTLSYLQKNGLLEMVDSDEYLLTETKNVTGCETASAARVRKHRDKKALQCNTDVTPEKRLCNKNVTPEIRDKRIRDKRESNNNSTNYNKQNNTPTRAHPKLKFAERIFMTQAEHDALVREYGEAPTREMISIVNAQKLAKGTRYDSDYGAILKWGVDAYNERRQAAKANGGADGTCYAPVGNFKTKDKGPYNCITCRGYGVLEYNAQITDRQGNPMTGRFLGYCPQCDNWTAIKGDNERANEQKPVPEQYLADAKPFTEML